VYYEGGPFPQFAVFSVDSDLVKHNEFMHGECVSFVGEDNQYAEGPQMTSQHND
jgi:hypothetical protein